jgi:hypothetical protein
VGPGPKFLRANCYKAAGYYTTVWKKEVFRKDLFSDQHEAKEALTEHCKADAMKKAYKWTSLSELLGVRAATEENADLPVRG